ncbi:hypothetical protein [Chroococcus sp. FPU101]|uniref:hypothetical protein n=1 Tax=Chroococcus sp. FPU101 TaxID=1974212 RepID=UPI001A8F391A|nr:hypothetical protein [Chroococcus sp. FPU101]GFE70656.1 hypothetical protein CFPU101_32660 [Chroococcus sp. FPU101]
MVQIIESLSPEEQTILEEKLQAKKNKKHFRYKEWASLLVQLKKDKTWLNEVNSQSLQQTLKDLESAFTKFFKKLGKFPRFKTR